MYNNITSQVLGVSAVGAGVAALPYTGRDPIFMLLPIISIACGAVILVSFILTRLIKRFF